MGDDSSFQRGGSLSRLGSVERCDPEGADVRLRIRQEAAAHLARHAEPWRSLSMRPANVGITQRLLSRIRTRVLHRTATASRSRTQTWPYAAPNLRVVASPAPTPVVPVHATVAAIGFGRSAQLNTRECDSLSWRIDILEVRLQSAPPNGFVPPDPELRQVAGRGVDDESS